MTASATTFGPAWPAPLGVSYSSNGVDPSAGLADFTYTIDNPGGYGALGWGQGLPDIDMQSRSAATLTFSDLSNSNLTATWTGSVDIDATGPSGYSGALNVELVATIQSGSTGWVQDTYSSQTGAPAYIALLDGSGSFSVSLEYLVQIPGADAWTPLAQFYNNDAYGGGSNYQTDTDGEFAGSLLPMTVADFQANKTSLDSSGAPVAISDLAANIGGANLNKLNDAHITSINVSDNGFVDADIAQLTSDATAISKLINNDNSAAQLDIKDTAANIQSNVSTLNANLAVIGQIDVTSGTVTVDAATAVSVGAQPFIDKIVGGVTVSDSAANVTANIDALNSDASVTSIALTDATPLLTLTVAQALDDTTALGEIANASYAIAISDTAANVAANIDALNSDASVTSITLTDATPLLTLTVAQALDDTTALGEIAGPYTIAIADSAAQVAANLDALNGDVAVTSITLTDGGAPALTLNVAQALGDTKALGEIAGPYTIAIADSAAHIAASLNALNGDASVTSIALTDSTPLLTLTVAQALNDTKALGEIANASYAVAISDTATHVAAHIDALNTDASVTSITLMDATPLLTLTVAQALNDTKALGEIANASYAVAISDSAAHVAAHIGALNFDTHVTSIALADATPVLTLTVAQALDDTTALGEIANASYAIAISDTAAHVAAQIGALNADTHVTSITLINTGTPALALTVAQALGDTKALGEIGTPYTIAISDTLSAVKNKLSQLSALGSKVSKITTAGTGHVTVTASSFNSFETTLNKIASHFAVSDTAANVTADLTALSADAAHIVSITATKGKVAVSTKTFGADKPALNRIAGGFVARDTAANVKTHLAALEGDVAHISAVDLTGTGTHTLSLTAAQDTADAALIAKIAAPYVLDVATSAGHTTTTGHGNGLKIADVKGTDAITGGGTSDIFVFAAGFGHATITDAHSRWTGATHDVIDFAKSEFKTFAALLSHATYSSSGTAIKDGTDVLTIDGIASKVGLTAADNIGDFKFV